MKLYRYLKAEYGIMALQTGNWKIGRLSELNDPLDCSPAIRGWEDSSITDEVATSFGLSISESNGLLCFSKSIDDPVLWSHYADSHRGMAFGFQFPNSTELHEVKYPESEDRKMVYFGRPDSKSEEAHDLLDAYTVKANSWKYEEEYRQFIDLNDCTLAYPHYLSEVPWQHLRSIHLGVRSSVTPTDIWNLAKARIQEGRSLAVYKAKLNPVSYKLQFQHSSYNK